MRAQYCREHIDKVAEECGLSDEYVSDVKRAAKFCARAGEFSDCSTASILALIDIRDDPVRDKAISSVSNALKSGKHPLTGEFLKDKKLSEKTVKKVIQQVEREVRGELTKKYEKERKEKPEPEDPLPVSPYVPQPGSITVSGKVQPSLAEQMKEPEERTSPPAPVDPPRPKPAPCKDFHPVVGKPQFVCPDLGDHMVVEKIRGRCCTVINIPLNQLPGNECPIERMQRLKGTAPEPFHRANDGLGNTFVKPPAYKISKSRLPDSERDNLVDSLIEHTGFTPKDIEQIDELVKVNREGWTCRFDLVEAAVMMLLAKAEGA